MLVAVLALVLAAGGVLVAAVLMARPEWAWLSVLLCALGAVLLVVERLRRRREASSSPPEPATATAPAARGPKHAAGIAREPAGTAEPPADPDEPAEEDTDAADALLVSESDEEVVVVDEHPRYHLAGCDRLGAHEVLGLPVRQARELGFSACARCTPDAVLAERLRAKG